MKNLQIGKTSLVDWELTYFSAIEIILKTLKLPMSKGNE